MAYFDHLGYARRKEQADKFEELKKHIRSLYENGKLNEWFLASQHIYDMEQKLAEQAEQIKKYQNFFDLLKSFLPTNNSFY